MNQPIRRPGALKNFITIASPPKTKLTMGESIDQNRVHADLLFNIDNYDDRTSAEMNICYLLFVA